MSDKIAIPQNPDERKIIDIGDLSLWRKVTPKWTRKEKGECLHRHFVADQEGEILTCKECGKQVSAFWALMRWADEYRRYFDALKSRAEAVRIREEKGLILKAAQYIEKAWRSRSMVPACPHCKTAIMPTDGFGGLLYNKADPEVAKRKHAEAVVYLGL